MLSQGRDGEPASPDGAGPSMPDVSPRERPAQPPPAPGSNPPQRPRGTPGGAPGGAPPRVPGAEPALPTPPPQTPAPAPQMPAPPRMPGPNAPVPGWRGAPPPPQPPVPGPSPVAPRESARLARAVPPAAAPEPAADLHDGIVGPVREADGGLPAESGPAEAESESVEPGSSADASATESSTSPAAAEPVLPVAPVAQGDWLASVCPYLASEDGTYRSATPDANHRCVAVDPPATLPLAFQERFCLTERHPRCEMYKFARERSQDDGVPIPADRLAATATRPVQGAAGGGSSNRPAIVAAAGIGGVAVLVLLLVLIMGSCSGGGGETEEPSAEAQPTQGAQATPTPRPTPTPDRGPTPTPDADATEPPDVSGMTVFYEIQEGEALLKIAERFDITRNRLRKDNPVLEDMAPADMPGEVIEIPMPAGMTVEEVEALPGFRGFAP